MAKKNNESTKLQESPKLILEFKGPYQRYAGGDIAVFDDDAGKKILSLKPAVAVEYQRGDKSED